MQKINFKNLPDTSTPLNAENLNLMQDNIENALSNIDYEDLINQPTIPEVVDSLDGDSTTNAPSVHAVKTEIDKITIYSTTEKIVGKTENGETIYEKTINYTSALTSGFNAIPHGITNKDKNIKSWGHVNGSPYYLNAYESANAFININYADATSVGIVVGTQWANAFPNGCTVTIQYTKTTN